MHIDTCRTATSISMHHFLFDGGGWACPLYSSMLFLQGARVSEAALSSPLPSMRHDPGTAARPWGEEACDLSLSAYTAYKLTLLLNVYVAVEGRSTAAAATGGARRSIYLHC